MRSRRISSRVIRGQFSLSRATSVPRLTLRVQNKRRHIDIKSRGGREGAAEGRRSGKSGKKTDVTLARKKKNRRYLAAVSQCRRKEHAAGARIASDVPATCSIRTFTYVLRTNIVISSTRQSRRLRSIKYKRSRDIT